MIGEKYVDLLTRKSFKFTKIIKDKDCKSFYIEYNNSVVYPEITVKLFYPIDIFDNVIDYNDANCIRAIISGGQFNSSTHIDYGIVLLDYYYFERFSPYPYILSLKNLEQAINVQTHRNFNIHLNYLLQNFIFYENTLICESVSEIEKRFGCYQVDKVIINKQHETRLDFQFFDLHNNWWHFSIFVDLLFGELYLEDSKHSILPLQNMTKDKLIKILEKHIFSPF